MALNINGTTGISGVDGSASAPALQGTDSNTGINFASDTINMNTGGVIRATIDSSGNLNPGANNSYDLGATGTRWKNIYTNDLNLSNEGSSNDVDSTWGSFTIQEGHHDLFLINKRTGKKYKFNLTEVS
tara:strand:+ start:423 stop:809 length:387 start_codon:yes stop_codon:yes gene_type:complete